MSPGRTTGASAEDILLAPDVADSTPNCKKVDVHDDGGTVPQKFNCLPVTLILIAIKERYVPTMEVQGGRGDQTWARDSPEFLSSQKNSVRFAAEEANPTINYRLDY